VATSKKVNAEGADRIIALDGCAVACAKLTLERAGLPISTYVVATELGIEKGQHFNMLCDQVDAICGRVGELLA
jgi:uncharacterized metal-binding protein